MAKIIVYNNNTDKMETYNRGEGDPMPYNTGNTLTVREFRGSSQSPTLWTTRRVMESFNDLRSRWGSPINVGFAFKRPWEGGHSNQSQHYAGTALDMAQGWTNAQRASLRSTASASGRWSYIEPVSISPTWVHVDRRQAPSACAAGYPTLSQGSLSTYVLVLEDGLNTLGFQTGGLDGIFGNDTRNAVIAFQQSQGLTTDGIVDCATWTALQSAVVAKGRSSTTID